MSKMGRPLEHLIYDANGKQFVGLSFDKGTKSYYALYKDEQGKSKKHMFGRDKETAIDRYQNVRLLPK